MAQVRGSGNSLSDAITRADFDAQSDQQMEEQLQMPKEYFEQMGNRYSGEGLRLEKAAAIVPFLRAYDSKLNHTVTHIEKRGISDDIHYYNCNFSYDGKYYGLDIS